MSKSKINPKGSSWDELEKQLFTSEEIAESEVRVAIINEPKELKILGEYEDGKSTI